jgi:hypothetical protein
MLATYFLCFFILFGIVDRFILAMCSLSLLLIPAILSFFISLNVQFRSLSSSPYSKSAIEEARKCAATRYELALRSISEATHDGNHEGTSDDGNSRSDVSIII